MLHVGMGFTGPFFGVFSIDSPKLTPTTRSARELLVHILIQLRMNTFFY